MALMKTTDELGAPLEKFVRRITDPRIDASAKYRCRVVAQSDDLSTLDVTPDSSKLPGLTQVPIHHTIPGQTVKVPAGAFCDVMFVEADLSKPVVMGFESGKALE